MVKKSNEKEIKTIVIEYTNGEKEVMTGQRAILLAYHNIDTEKYVERYEKTGEFAEKLDPSEGGMCHVFGESDEDISFVFMALMESVIDQIGVHAVSNSFMKLVGPIVAESSIEHREEVLEEILKEKGDVIN